MVKILKGVPYTGTLPATLTGTKAGYLHRYKIFGNTEQTGTPTPENPIYPSECGERTDNLFDLNATDTTNGYIYNAYLKSSGETATVERTYIVTEYIPVISDSTYTISRYGDVAVRDPSVCFYDDNHDYLSGVAYNNNRTISVGVPANAKYLRFSAFYNYKSNTMLNSGSTALPYEPYGYKLPLTSGSTPVDIYIGESQTTRRIRKLVLTGEETINGMTDANDGAKAVSYTYSALGMTDIINNGRGMNAIPYPIYLSSHFKRKTSGYSSWFNINTGEIGANSVQSNTVNKYLVFGTSEQTQADFKAYLAQQYANGTPVTVWYILATPRTGTLNEPLRKIGDYVDAIDSTQTSAQIPTTANSTTISWAGQGLAPSEFDSIQEWVDNPSYKRVNGEWVADN